VFHRFLAFSLVALLASVLGNSLLAQEKPKDKAPPAGDKAPAAGDKAAPAGGGVLLKWKFEKDKPFYQEMTTETNQTMMIQGNKVENQQKQTFYFSWTPKSEDKDGNWTLAQKIEGLKMDFTISGSKVSYDSTKESTGNNPLGDFFKVLVGSEFTVTLDKNLKATKIDGSSDFLKKLTGQNPQMEPLLKSILNEDTLKEMAGPTFASLPAKEVKPGDTWESPPVKLDMGPIGRYDVSYKYTYEGKGKDKGTENFEKIKVDTVLKYTEPADTVGGLPFKIKKAELQPTKSTGVIYFDNTKGRMESSDSEMEIKGKLNIEIAGMITTVDLTQTQKTTIKNLDKNPVEPAKK
jgi:hypothetical protein